MLVSIKSSLTSQIAINESHLTAEGENSCDMEEALRRHSEQKKTIRSAVILLRYEQRLLMNKKQKLYIGYCWRSVIPS